MMLSDISSVIVRMVKYCTHVSLRNETSLEIESACYKHQICAITNGHKHFRDFIFFITLLCVATRETDTSFCNLCTYM